MSKEKIKEEERMRRRFRREFINYDIWAQEFSPKEERTYQLLFNLNETLNRLVDSLDAIFVFLQAVKHR